MQLENLQRSIQTNSSLIGQFFRHIRQSHLNIPSETFKNSWWTPFFQVEKFVASTQKQMAAEVFRNVKAIWFLNSEFFNCSEF